MKVFIPMFNRLTWPKKLALDLTERNCEVILIDNNSTYPELLEWYNICPYKVYRLNKNYGERVLWLCGIDKEYSDRYYIVTDPDLDVGDLPYDFIDKLRYGLDNNHTITKCGLSLLINDLPDNIYANHAKEFESKYWLHKDNLNNFSCGIDTTLAIYDRERLTPGWNDGVRFYLGTRTPPPYSARHMPWYLTKEDIINDKEQYFYHQSCNNQWSLYAKRIYNI
jgi:hypothetical protein